MRRLVIITITKMVKLCHYVHLIKENDISKTYQMSQFVLVQFSIKSGKGKIEIFLVTFHNKLEIVSSVLASQLKFDPATFELLNDS